MKENKSGKTKNKRKIKEIQRQIEFETDVYFLESLKLELKHLKNHSKLQKKSIERRVGENIAVNRKKDDKNLMEVYIVKNGKTFKEWREVPKVNIAECQDVIPEPYLSE